MPDPIESRELPVEDALVSALGWFTTDADHGGHRSDCDGGRDCHCGFENLTRTIDRAIEDRRSLLSKLEASERDAAQMSDFRNWLMLAFRALNDAGGVIETVSPEEYDEEWRLAELRERLGALAIQAPILLGMTAREVDEAVDSAIAKGA